MGVRLGDKVRDVVTGFEGIATSRVEYLTGCTQIGVSGAVQADGKTNIEYFDESRVTAKTVDELRQMLAVSEVQSRHAAAGGPSVQVPARHHP